MNWILTEVPDAKPFMEWIMTGFTFGLGWCIGRISIRYEEACNVAATAVIG